MTMRVSAFGRPGGRIDIAARHTEITAEAGVSGCHADTADAPSEVARQPGADEGESRVVLEHSYKYSAQMARETSTATLLLLLAIASFSPAIARADEPDCPQPAAAERGCAIRRRRRTGRSGRRSRHHRGRRQGLQLRRQRQRRAFGKCRHAPGRQGHPRRSPGVRGEDRAGKAHRRRRILEPRAQGARQQRRAIRRRSARSSRARSSSCRSATRAARRAACRWTRTAAR